MFSKERLLELVSSLASSAAQIARKSFSQGEAFWFHNDLSGQGRLHLKRVIERCLCLPEIGTSSVTAAPIQEPAAGCERKDVLLNCAERCRSWLRRKYISRKAKGKGSFSTFDQVINNMKLSTLPAYASSLRQSRAGAGLGPTSGFKCALRTSPKFGSYHLAFPVVFKDGAKWLFKIPAAGYVGRWDSSAARALRSEALTMRMLRQQTSIPIPEVYSFDASLDNDFRCPFILMEYMDGEPLYEKWYNGFASIGAQEKFREQALRSLATATVQLSAFKYSQAGSPSFDENGNLQAIEPARVVDHPTNHRRLCAKIFDNYENFCDLGPYHNSADYFQCMLDKHLPNKTDISRGVSQALRLFLDWIPKEAPIETETFVMAHPDFNLQNVLVAEDGTLQGLIDWDGVSAVPRSVGCLFPKWLTFDWDPNKYTYGMDFGSKFQYHHSPAEMKHYRALYAGFIAESATKCQAQAGDIPQDLADLTRRSLVIDSVNQAAKSPFSTAENVFNILDKITHITSQTYFKAYCEAYEGTIKEGELTNPVEHNIRIESVAQAEEHSSTNGSSDLGDSVFSDTSMVTRDSIEISEPPSEQEGQQTAALQHSDPEASNDNDKEEQGIVNQQSSKTLDKRFLNSTKEKKPWRRVPSLVQSTSHQLRASMKRLKVTKSQRMQSSWVTLSPKTVQTNTFETNSTTSASTSSRTGKINQEEPLSNNLASILHDEAFGEKDGTISATASGRLHIETTVKQKIKQNQTDASDTDGQRGLSPNAHCVQCQVPVLSTEHLNALPGSVRLQKEQVDGSLPSNSLSGTSVLRKDTFGRRLKAKLSRASGKKGPGVRTSSPKSSADSGESRCKRILSWIRKTSQKPLSDEQKSVSSWDSDSTLPEIPNVSLFELPSMDEADFKMKNDMKDMNDTMGESSNNMTKLVTTSANKLPYYDAGEPVGKDKLHREGFSSNDIVFDLADGKFDETRMRRLRLGFAALLDSL